MIASLDMRCYNMLFIKSRRPTLTHHGTPSTELKIFDLCVKTFIQNSSIFLSFFTPRITNCNLRGSGLNVVQPLYSLVMHKTTHFCLRLPTCGIISFISYHQILDHFCTISFSFEWGGVCRVPVYELYILTQIFNVRSS